MAAGVGSRLSKHFNGIPKCCIEFNNESLISRSVRILNSYGVNDVSVVVGYPKQNIIDELKNYNVKIYHNPFYSISNSIASLWFAREELVSNGEDILIMNGDLFYEPQIIEEVLASNELVTIFSDPRRIEDADYRLFYKNSKLLLYGKELPNEKTTGEYIGIAKLSSKIIIDFNQYHKDLIETQHHGMWWDDVLYKMSDDGIQINVQELQQYFWSEIDYIEDYNRTLGFVNTANIK